MSEEIVIEGTGEVVPAGSMALATARRSDYGLIRAESPQELMGRASEAANVLASMIRAQKLSVRIQGREFVKVEGWATLAAMMGATPHEVENAEDPKRPGVYVAVVELRRIADGAVVGRGSGECGAPDELDRDGKPVWTNRPAYARRSMASTRATGKACRLAYSWIMGLAGYEVTPAEEVPPGGFGDAPAPASRRVAADKLTGRRGDDHSPIPDADLPAAMTFGKSKGVPLGQLKLADLAWYLKAVGENLENPEKARFHDKALVEYRALRREHARRLDAQALEAEYEAHAAASGERHAVAADEYSLAMAQRENAPGPADDEPFPPDVRETEADDHDLPF